MTQRRSVKDGTACPGIIGVIASQADLRRALRIRKPPDFFELRLDHLAGNVDELANKLPILQAPLIITARTPREGGANNLSIKQRRELLMRFLPQARYIDVELRSVPALQSLLELARRKNVRAIISFHDLKSTPDSRSLRAKARTAKSCGADIFKVATRTDTPEQFMRLFAFFTNRDVDLAVSAMGIGKLGAASRIALAQSGSMLNYASIGPSKIEGQLSIRQLRSVLAR
jgi:3-dehydroquinate dehydratase I